VLLCFNFTASAQKAFTQRTSTKATQPYTGKSIYNLRGDFEMMGNTNLIASAYKDNDDNNDKTMSYVDIDNDASTANSSAAYLNIPTDACTQIVYAGLYWSGRAETSGNGSYTITQDNVTVVTGIGPNTDQTINHNGSYGLTITRQGSSSSTRYPRYELNLDGTIVQIDFTNSTGNDRVQYRTGTSGSFTNVPGTYTTSGSGNNTVGNFTPTGNQLKFTINGKNYEIKSLKRHQRTDGSGSDYTNASRNNITLNAPTITTSTVNKTYDKRKVKLKIEGDSYMDVTAADSDILYPGSTYDNIYAGYADVTDYVRQKGAGNYYVADIALKNGNGGGTGYSGGWGMIVIYENPEMKWRDITIFDGHAYVVSGSSSVNRIELSGFKAAQAGDINVDMGFLAAEGEYNLTGDYFRMRRSDITDTTLPTYGTTIFGTFYPGTLFNQSAMDNSLSSANGQTMDNYPFITTTNTTRLNNNFFNSSIGNGYDEDISPTIKSRTPFYKNNYGFDLAKIKLDNADKKFIKNSQTATTFYYGTSKDTYVIYNVVFAVDAYVPETEVLAQITPTVGVDINNLQPNDEVTLTADIFNYGSDAISNGNLQITIPAGMQLVSTSVHTNTQADSGANASYSFNSPTWINPTGGSNAIPAATLGGILEWKLGNVPTQNLVNGNKVPMATLTYKLKVTDNCVILQASKDNCILLPEVEGEITGKGVNSKADFEQVLTIGYNTDCNNTPIYGGLNMEIKPSTTFLDNCSANNPVVNEVRMFKRFCSVAGNVIPRAEITSVYPTGTKFYTDGGVEVTGDFAVNANGTVINYRAVLSGSPISCYLKLATQLDVITTQPTTTNVTVCQGESIVLNNQPSNVAYQLFYFQNQTDTTQMTGEPAPTTAGVHTYWVAEGTTNGSTTCFGPKKSFTIIINAAPTALVLENVELCTFADYASTINSNGATATWEYYNGATWGVVNTQLVGVAIVANQLKITKAPATLNGTKFRVKLTNTNNCSSVSNEMTLTVKGCQMPVNPMIYTPLKR